MATYRLMDGASGRPGVGSSGTQPPSAPTAYTGAYEAGLIFFVTGTVWFTGYYWWVPTGGDTTAIKCALWSVSNSGGSTSTLLASSVVTSGTLTAGQWNFVAIPTPILLAQDCPYTAAIGYVASHGFPNTQHQFGSGNPYAAGITNGPLSCYYSNQIYSIPQQPFTTAGSDPSVIMPGQNDLDDLLWIDVQVQDTAPTGFNNVWRLFPNQPRPVFPGGQGGSTDPTGYTLAVEFSLTSTCSLQKIWHYSPTSHDQNVATVLPSRCAIWNVSTQTAVAGTDNASPTWLLPGGGAASPAAGWVYCDYSSSGINLAASTNYKVSTFYTAGSGFNWFGVLPGAWGPGGIYANGITMGALVAPNNAGATPGQQSWNPGATWAYPNTSLSPEADFIDVEVQVVSAGTVNGTVDIVIPLTVSATGVIPIGGGITIGPLITSATGVHAGGGNLARVTTNQP